MKDTILYLDLVQNDAMEHIQCISYIVYVHTLVHVHAEESSSVFNMEIFIPILTLEQSVNDAKGAIYLIDLLQI